MLEDFRERIFGIFERKPIDQIYTYETLKNFAFSLIAIFIPIYIASEGSPLSWVFIFLIVLASSLMIASTPISWVISKTGFKHSLILSYFFYLPVFVLLRFVEITFFLVVLTATLIGIGKALHWLSLHSEFAIDSKKGKRGIASGRIIGLPKVARAIGPFLGGVIMSYFGFHLLATVTIIFTLISIAPLFASRDHKDPLESNILSFLDKKHLKLGTLFVLRGTGIAVGAYLFPLFVYYLVGGTINAGSALSLTALGSVAFSLFVGRISEKIEKHHLLIVGSIASGVLFFLRAYISTPIEAFLISFLAGLMAMVYYVPLYSKLADFAEGEDVLEFYAFRELTLGIGKIGTFGLAMYFALTGSISLGFTAAFFLAGAATLGLSLYARSLFESKAS